MRSILQKYLIHQLELSPGLVLAEDTPIHEVARVMREKKIGCIVTSNKNAVTGIFTERDLLSQVVAVDNPPWDEPLKNLTTKDPVTMKSNEPLPKAMYLMRKKNFRHIPIFDDADRLKGVLSIRNVVKLLAEHFPQEVMNLPPELNKLPKTPEGG